MSIVLIPINGNSCKLVYCVGFGFFIAEIPSETQRNKWNYHLNRQTFQGNKSIQVQHPLKNYRTRSNAQWCNGKRLISFYQLLTLQLCLSPITNDLAVDKSDPGWLPFGWLLVEEISARCLFEPHILKYFCISKLISITRSCIHEITWCWFGCLNFQVFTKFHKNVFFQKYWYSKNLPPNNISKHHHSILGLASTSVADEDVSLNLATRQWNRGWEAAEFGWLDRIQLSKSR